MNHYYIYGKTGDIIYAIPAIKKHGGGIIINGLPINDHHSLKPLIDCQPGLTLEHESTYGFPADTINLECIRYAPEAGKRHVCHVFADYLGVEITLDPWLVIPGPSYFPTRVCVVNITKRYRDKLFNWRREIGFMKNYSRVVFVGTPEEYHPYKDLCIYEPTDNLLQVAQMLKKCHVFAGTQSACLAIAIGMGIQYKFEQSPFYSNVNTGRLNEEVLNKSTRGLHFALSQLQSLIRFV